jgi:ketosteroid isomerase-like protein
LTAVNREHALQLLARLHTAQNAFYSGGEEGELRTLLTPDIAWHVPGRNLIAGTYRGHDQVIAYYTRRRDLAGNTFQITNRDVLAGHSNTIAAIADGTATVDGTTHRWTAVGLYTIIDNQVAECWLLPTEPDLFDRIWSE